MQSITQPGIEAYEAPTSIADAVRVLAGGDVTVLAGGTDLTVQTDAGRITYGNRIFIEYSGYSEEELLGTQHNIIRHPDMPRAVFKLLWDTIGQGEEIFAYGILLVPNDLKPGEHPIIPVMLGDAKLATAMADKLLERGIYVIGFSYPVVPKGEARIRVQISAAHSTEQVDQAIEAFSEVGRDLGVLSGAAT